MKDHYPYRTSDAFRASRAKTARKRYWKDPEPDRARHRAYLKRKKEEAKKMSEEKTGIIGDMSPTTEADIAAFRFIHPVLDSTKERVLFSFGPSEDILEQRVTFEIFHFDGEGVGEIIFDVRGIKDALAARKLVFQMFDVPLDEAWIEHIRKNGGVEVERMASLTATDLERPPIGIVWPHNGCTTIIDGNNRLVRRWDDGLRSVRIAVIKLYMAVAPFMCRPGEEEQFLRRRQAEDPRADHLTSLGVTRVVTV